MEALDNNVIAIFQELQNTVPKSCGFVFSIDDSNSHHHIHDMLGNRVHTQRISPPRITFTINGPAISIFEKFNSLMVVGRSATVSSRLTDVSATFMVGDFQVFIEEYERIFKWAQYSQEFDALIEEELSKNK